MIHNEVYDLSCPCGIHYICDVTLTCNGALHCICTGTSHFMGVGPIIGLYTPTMKVQKLYIGVQSRWCDSKFRYPQRHMVLFKSDHWMKFINDGFYYILALHCVMGVGEDSGYGARVSLISFHSMACRIPT